MINEHVLKQFGRRIKSLRTALNISQEALAHRTGFHRTYIGMVERGERNISLANIAVFAKIFELTVSDLLDFSSLSGGQKASDYQTKSEL